MKVSKTLIMGMILTLSISPIAIANISDELDQNNIEAPFEEREEEVNNSSDVIDENYTPAFDEKREREEEVRSDFEQNDDAVQTYDDLEEEIDEN